MNDCVPSIGSRIQVRPDRPAVSGSSSPTMPSSGKAAAIRSRSRRSAERSAMVTGVPSDLPSTARSDCRNHPRVSSPASRAMSTANRMRASSTGGASCMAAILRYDARRGRLSRSPDSKPRFEHIPWPRTRPPCWGLRWSDPRMQGASGGRNGCREFEEDDRGPGRRHGAFVRPAGRRCRRSCIRRSGRIRLRRVRPARPVLGRRLSGPRRTRGTPADWCRRHQFHPRDLGEDRSGV